MHANCYDHDFHYYFKVCKFCFHCKCFSEQGFQPGMVVTYMDKVGTKLVCFFGGLGMKYFVKIYKLLFLFFLVFQTI